MVCLSITIGLGSRARSGRESTFIGHFALPAGWRRFECVPSFSFPVRVRVRPLRWLRAPGGFLLPRPHPFSCPPARRPEWPSPGNRRPPEFNRPDQSEIVQKGFSAPPWPKVSAVQIRVTGSRWDRGQAAAQRRPPARDAHKQGRQLEPLAQSNWRSMVGQWARAKTRVLARWPPAAGRRPRLYLATAEIWSASCDREGQRRKVRRSRRSQWPIGEPPRQKVAPRRLAASIILDWPLSAGPFERGSAPTCGAARARNSRRPKSDRPGHFLSRRQARDRLAPEPELKPALSEQNGTQTLLDLPLELLAKIVSELHKADRLTFRSLAKVCKFFAHFCQGPQYTLFGHFDDDDICTGNSPIATTTC